MSDDHPVERTLSGPSSIEGRFLQQCDAVYRIEVAFDGTVTSLNDAARLLFGGDAAGYAGAAISRFLVAADAARLAELLEHRPADEAITLNVGAGPAVPRTLHCLAYALPDRLLLLGYERRDPAERLERSLIGLNNELTAALRDQAKTKAALRRASADLAQALDDLKRSHWLIERIQDLLPVCMECGRVKTTDGAWQDVISFLKTRSSFLSHGYCPDCYARIAGRQAQR
jgi:hypothetical protein